jgi:hypothetical protein
MMMQNITFSVLAEDGVNSVKKFSPLLTIEIYFGPNLHPPTLNVPPNFEMLTNETKNIELPAPTDNDQVDTPIISSFLVESSSRFGNEFITYDNATRKISINPRSNDTYAGTFDLII